ncbi:hypothetical protein HDU87_005192 [Geranomyces variabilis]|uniref:serine--tRNA ligase n=1 Tax=Geranomyces variabilis TaxID=109894 RepID=A0AAD5XPF7_9FUNG|nr:hypothetical protein HDU87_005192 [Geranomyces variabilis]
MRPVSATATASAMALVVARGAATRRCFTSSLVSRHASQQPPSSSSLPAKLPPQPPNARQFKPHLNYRYIRDNVSALQENCVNRNALDVDVAKVAALYDSFVAADYELGELRRWRNAVAVEMASLVGQAKKDMGAKGADTDVSIGSRRKVLAEQGRNLKASIAKHESLVADLQSRLYEEARHIPNDTHPQSPIGDESNATVLSTTGTPRGPTFPSGAPLRSHMDIMLAHDMVDFDRAGKVAGSSFYYLRNMGAMLEMALCRFAMDTCIAEGFTPVVAPDVIRHEVLEACGFNPRSEDPQTYYIAPHDPAAAETTGTQRDPLQLCLTATAEFPLAAAHANETLPRASLPLKSVASSHAFRAEGLAGAANRGLYRVHQFTKIEMFALTPRGGDTSAAVLADMVRIQRHMYAALGLCFRELDMPTHDLGAPAFRKIDIEAWMPGRGSWGEISSASDCTDFQSRRLNIRTFSSAPRPPVQARDADAAAKQPQQAMAAEFVHTVNGTACAVPRLIIAILETHQTEDGNVRVPEALRPYLWGLDTIRAGIGLADLVREQQLRAKNE